MQEWAEAVKGLGLLVDKVGPTTAVILFIWFLEHRKKLKFEWSDGRIKKSLGNMEDNIIEHFDKVMKDHEFKCGFDEEHREKIECAHGHVANEEITRKEMISAIDDNTMVASQLLNEIKTNRIIDGVKKKPKE